MNGQRILITGGAGFIGAHLAARLADVAQVAVFDNLLPQAHAGNPGNLARVKRAGVPVYQGDIRDESALRRAIRTIRPQVVIHLAAETGTAQSHDLAPHYTDVNVTGTATFLAALRGAGDLRRVILASSRAVYGEGAAQDMAGHPARPVTRRACDLARGDFALRDGAGRILRPVATHAACPPAPVSIYASTKLMQEYLLTQGFWGSGVGVGILRLHNTYGPGQTPGNPYTGVLAHFAENIRAGRELAIYEDGAITRDFIYVDDVVDAFMRMVFSPYLPDAPLDIGTGQGITIAAVARRMLDLAGGSMAITGKFRPGDIRHAVADITAARGYGWRPRVTLDDGLGRLLAWAGCGQRAA